MSRRGCRGPGARGGEWVEFLRALLDQPIAVEVDVLAALGRLIPADAVFYTDLVPHRRSRWAESSTLSGLPPCEPEGDEVLCRHVWSASCSHSGRTSASTGTAAAAAWPPGHSRWIRFIRERGRDFDATDRALAALVRPHLVAHLHALDLTGRGTSPLTTRQRQLMELVGDGLSNIQAARRLGISAHTVRTHLQQICTRLGVSSRGQAAALLRPRG